MAGSSEASAKASKGAGQKQSRVIPYASQIGVQARDAFDLIQRVEQGLTYTAFESLLGLLPLNAGELAGILQIPPRTLTRRKQEGRFRPDESERLLRLSRVINAATELFEGDRRAAVSWMQSPNKAFQGGTPLEMARTEVGAREVENLIGRLEHGVFA